MRVAGLGVSRIGAFRPRRDPTVGAAIRVFGTPSTRDLTRSNGCRVQWRALRLRVLFYNFGGAPVGQTTCASGVGRAQSLTIRGRRFRTWKGLRVGMASDRIPELHPAAEFRQGSWWLRTATSPFGDGSEYGVLRAIVGDGRVRAFAGWIGAAGE